MRKWEKGGGRAQSDLPATSCALLKWTGCCGAKADAAFGKAPKGASQHAMATAHWGWFAAHVKRVSEVLDALTVSTQPPLCRQVAAGERMNALPAIPTRLTILNVPSQHDPATNQLES